MYLAVIKVAKIFASMHDIAKIVYTLHVRWENNIVCSLYLKKAHFVDHMPKPSKTNACVRKLCTA